MRRRLPILIQHAAAVGHDHEHEENTIDEIGEINEYIQNETGNSANIIMGVGEDLELGNNISVTVIATGFGDEKQKSLVSSETKKVVYKLDQDHPFEKSLMNKDELDHLTHESDEIVEDKLNNESQQKKIESEINEILRNIDISYEVVEPETKDFMINDIELRIENSQFNPHFLALSSLCS